MATKARARCTALALLAASAAAGCRLEVDVPVEPPPETWDPALDSHPDGPIFLQLIEDYVHRGLPGVSFYVRSPEGQWNGAAGYAKLETSDPMLPTHRHFAASVTKMYTATAVMLLAEEGAVDLDAGIREYLPASVYDRVPNGKGATVRQLLGHTSGIPDFGAALAYDLDTLNDPMGAYPPERLLAYLHGLAPRFPPGTGYWYSNANYLLLALIADRVTGTSHADTISEKILRPLALGSTYYKNEAGYPRPPGAVNSYVDLAGDGRLMNVSDLTIHDVEVATGYAGLIASSADYAAFLEALLEGQVLSRASLAEMKTRTECDCYGLGLSFVDTPYGPGIGHSGGDLGSRGEVRHFSEVGATLVLWTNGGDSGVTGDLFDQLWEELETAALDDLPLRRRHREPL